MAQFVKSITLKIESDVQFKITFSEI